MSEPIRIAEKVVFVLDNEDRLELPLRDTAKAIKKISDETKDEDGNWSSVLFHQAIADYVLRVYNVEITPGEADLVADHITREYAKKKSEHNSSMLTMYGSLISTDSPSSD